MLIDEFVDRQAADTDLVELTDQRTGEVRQYRTRRLETVTEPGTPLNKQTLDPLLHAIRGKQGAAGNPVSIPETVRGGYPFEAEIYPETTSWMMTRHGGVGPESPGQLVQISSVTVRSSNKNLCSFTGPVTATNQLITGYDKVGEGDTLVYTLGRGVYTYSAYIDNTLGNAPGRVEVYKVTSGGHVVIEPLSRRDIPLGGKGRASVTVDYGAIDTSDAWEIRLGVVLDAQGTGKTVAASFWQLEAGYAATGYTPHTGASKTVSAELIKLSDIIRDRIYLDNATYRWKLERQVKELTITSAMSPNPQAFSGNRTRFFHWDSQATAEPAEVKYSLCSHFPYGDESGTNVFYRESGNWAFVVDNAVLGIQTTDTAAQRTQKWGAWLADHNITIYSAWMRPQFAPPVTDLFADAQEDTAFTEALRPYDGTTHISLDKEPEYGGMLTMRAEYPMGKLGADLSNLSYKMATIDAITVQNAAEKAQAALTTANTAASNLGQVSAALESAIADMDGAADSARTAASEAQVSSAKADTAADRADTAAREAEELLSTADGKYANAVTGFGEGPAVSCPDILPGAPVLSAEIQGKTVEQGAGDKGPYNPYRFVSVSPTKLTLTEGTRVTEVPLPTIDPLYSLPSGTRDTYDAVTGTETRRVGIKVLTGTEHYTALGSDRVYTAKPPNAKPRSEEGVVGDQITAHGLTVAVSDVTYIGVPFLCEAGDTDAQRVEKAKEYFAAQYAAGTPVTVLYPLKDPAVTRHEPVTVCPGERPCAVSADQGEIAVTYVQDTKLVVRGLEEQVRELQQTDTRYGVRFTGGENTGETVTRLYNAAGLTAGVGTDTETAVNDFDGVYPWSARRRCCGRWNQSGNFVVNAYQGEPGYAEDGTNGEVWVEHSVFYYRHDHTPEGAEEIVLSAVQLPGFDPAPVFVKPDGSVTQKAYTAAYPMAVVDGKATSRAGVFSDVCSLNTSIEKARTLGSNYTVTTTAEWYTECLYMWVEFATRNLQSVMAGATNLPHAKTHTAVATEEGVNRVILSSANAASYVTGQTILIGTSLGAYNVANNRIITGIEEYDAQNKALLFDGEPVNIAAGNVVSSAAWINGSCSGVLSSSGSPVSNKSGRYNCVYRGKEMPYGNATEQIADVLLKKAGEKTEIHFLSDPTKYAGGEITEEYVKLTYTAPAATGWVKTLGTDSRYPWVRLPSENGGSSGTYYSDQYFPPRGEIGAACVGGAWGLWTKSGPCFWYCYNAPANVNVNCRARLSYHR